MFPDAAILTRAIGAIAEAGLYDLARKDAARRLGPAAPTNALPLIAGVQAAASGNVDAATAAAKRLRDKRYATLIAWVLIRSGKPAAATEMLVAVGVKNHAAWLNLEAAHRLASAGQTDAAFAAFRRLASANPTVLTPDGFEQFHAVLDAAPIGQRGQLLKKMLGLLPTESGNPMVLAEPFLFDLLAAGKKEDLRQVLSLIRPHLGWQPRPRPKSPGPRRPCNSERRPCSTRVSAISEASPICALPS